MNSKTNKLASFSCVVATIAKCNILKSVLGLHKLASTAKQTMFEIHKLASNRQRVFGLARGSGSCGGDNGPPDNGGHSGLCPLLSTCVQGVDSHPKPPGLQLQPSRVSTSRIWVRVHQVKYHAHCTCSDIGTYIFIGSNVM